MELGIPTIGIDLGGTNVRAGLVQDGKIRKSATGRIAGLTGRQEVLDRICSVIEEVGQAGAASIGIGVPSIVDPKKGIVYDTVNIPSWTEVHVKDILEAKYGIPVWVNNDANCFALGEKYYGKGAGCGNLAGVTIGTGLGTGIVIEGKLYNGANCGVGEIGNIPYKDHIVEYYASGQYFQHIHGESGENFLRRAQAGDEQAKEVFYQYGLHLGHALLIILYAYDPEMIVLGGSVSQCFGLFEKGMRESLKVCLFPHSLERLQIVCSDTKDIAILGASLLSKEHQLF